MATHRARYYDGRSHAGWNPYQEYEVYEGEEGLRRPRHQSKNHVAFKDSVEAVRDENEGERVGERVRHSDGKASQSVDEEAEAFIKTQHKRIELAKLMSLRAADPTIT